MSISGAIYTLIHRSSSVAAIVGTKIEPNFQPKGTAYPFIVWEKVSLQTNPTSDTQSGYDIYRIEVKSVAATKTACESLAVLVRAAMNITTPETVSSVLIHRVFLDNETDLFDFNGGYEGAFTISQDYLIHVKS